MEPIQNYNEPSIVLSLSGNTGPINISLQGNAKQDINAVKSIVGGIISGDVEYNECDEKLISIFKEFGGRLEAIQLRSDLDQLKDSSTPEATKNTSKNRLTAFIYKAAAKASDKGIEVGINMLLEYLKNF